MESRIALWRLRAVCHNTAWRSIAVLGNHRSGRFLILTPAGAAK